MKVIKKIGLMAAVLILLISGCTSSSSMPQQDDLQTMTDLDVPEGFDWDFTRDIQVNIQTVDSMGNPVAGKEISVYKPGYNKVFNSATNAAGELSIEVTSLESTRELTIAYDGKEKLAQIVGNQVNEILVVEPVREIRDNGTLYVPGENSVLTVMFEDMWPEVGDYDFNDMVVENWGKLRYESNYLRYIELETTVIASGAQYFNGFEIMFETTAYPNTAMGDVITFSAFDENDNPLFGTSLEVHEAYGTDVIWDTYNEQLKFKFFDNVYDVMPRPLGFLSMNTLNEQPWTDPVTIRIRIDYAQLIAFNPSNPDFQLNALNPYIVVDGVDGYEVHLPGEPYTASFNQFALFGTGDDVTPATGIASPLYETQGYRTADGYSWGLKLEGQLEYAREKADMVTAYPRLGQYFNNELGIFENWWQPHPDDDYSEGYIMDRQDLTWEEQNAPVGE